VKKYQNYSAYVVLQQLPSHSKACALILLDLTEDGSI